MQESFLKPFHRTSTISVAIRNTKYKENEENVVLKTAGWTIHERNDTFVRVRTLAGKLIFSVLGIGVL